jgi:lysophospholipase L1-like esterase
MRAWGSSAAAVALATAVPLVLSSCSADPADPVLDYVALGDSYTSGAMLAVQVHEGCLRSDHNYPSLLAAARDDVRLTDASCAGAATEHLAVAQAVGEDETVPPQLDALSEDTDLVTIALGANDGAFAQDWLFTCAALGREHPRGTPCRDADEAQPVPMVDRLEVMATRLAQGLAEVRERAPRARVVVVGYPQVVPASGTCRDRLPMAERDYSWARELNEALDRTVRHVAEGAGVELLDLWELSADHHVCAEQPWFNGQLDQPGRAQAYHPFLAFHEAVAEELAKGVAGPGSQ